MLNQCLGTHFIDPQNDEKLSEPLSYPKANLGIVVCQRSAFTLDLPGVDESTEKSEVH